MPITIHTYIIISSYSYYCNTVMRIQSFMDFSDPQKMVAGFQISEVVTGMNS